MRRLSPVDLSFLLLERAARPMVMGLIQVFAPPAGVRGADYATRLHRAFVATRASGKFAVKVNFLATGGPAWEEATPEMDVHVRRLTLAPPGDDRALLALAGRLHETLLDRTRPLWEMFIIDGLENDQVAVVGRVHHAMFDGISGIRALFETLNTEAKDPRVRPIWTELPPRPRRARGERVQPSLAQRAGTALKNVSSLSRQVLQMAGDVSGLRNSSRGWPLFSAAPTALPKTPYDSMGRSYASAYIPLAAIKAVAKAAEVTVNDVALAVSDIALRTYLNRLGDRVPQALVASVPVSTRAEGDDSTSNAAAMAQTKLGAADLAPLPRLKEISANMQALKAAMREMPPAAQQALALSTFGIAQAGDMPLLNKALPLTSNLLISNIPPQGDLPLFLGGGRLMRMHGLPILPMNHSANITLAAYAGELCFGIVASSAVIPDAWPLANDLEHAFASLQRALKVPAGTQSAGAGDTAKAKPVTAKTRTAKTTASKVAATPGKTAAPRVRRQAAA